MKFSRSLKKGFYSLNEYWKSAAVLSFKYRERTRLYFFVDILYCTLRYGANDTDCILLDYYKKTHFNRNQYITWLRTFAINSKLDERGVHELINRPTIKSRISFNKTHNHAEHPFLPSRHDGGGSLHGVGGAGLGVDYHRAED